LVFGTSPTIGTPAITGGTINALTGFSLRDTSAAFNLSVGATSSPALSANRSLTFDVINSNRTIKLNGNLDVGGNLTTANSFTTSGNFALTLTATGTTNVTLPTTGTLAITGNGLNQFASTTSAQLAGVISDETGSGALVFGTSPTIGTPAITGGTINALTGFSLRDTSAAFNLTIAATSNPALTAGRTLTFDVSNVSRTISLNGNVTTGGNLTTANSFTTSGNFALTLTATGTTNVTLPTTGTLATTGNLSQFAATTSAQLAGVISDETGSGALVFGTTPNLTRPNITAMSQGTSSSTADSDLVIDAATTSLFYWEANFTAARTLQISNLTDGRMVRVYMRNSNGTARAITIQASTTTSGYVSIVLAIAQGTANTATAVTLAATNGRALLTVFNANGNFAAGV